MTMIDETETITKTPPHIRRRDFATRTDQELYDTVSTISEGLKASAGNWPWPIIDADGFVLETPAVEDIRSAIDSLTLVVDEIEYRRARAIVDQYEKGTPNKYKIYSGQPFPSWSGDDPECGEGRPTTTY